VELNYKITSRNLREYLSSKMVLICIKFPVPAWKLIISKVTGQKFDGRLKRRKSGVIGDK
jgi:hypothetical protein